MNEVMQAILSRRSIRQFTDQEVPKDVLQDLAQAALHAPSGMGKKTWKFTVVSNREKIRELAGIMGKVLGREGYNMYDPTALIIPSNLKESPFGKEDNACALENIFLAAYSYGVGSVRRSRDPSAPDTDGNPGRPCGVRNGSTRLSGKPRKRIQRRRRSSLCRIRSGTE